MRGVIPFGDKIAKRSERVALDPEPVDLLKQAVNIKFKVQENKKEMTWPKARDFANRHCYDLAKNPKP